MAHINLLPWREQAKQRSKQQFMTLMAAVALVSFMCILSVGLVYDSRTQGQLARNKYLTDEIAVLDKKIAAIRTLNEKKKDLQQRMNVVMNLQESRNVGTQIVNAISDVVPAGIYLTKLERHDNIIIIIGKSESNNRLANMMRNIEQSPTLQNPILESIVAGKTTSILLSDFVMRVSLTDVTLAVTEESK